MPRAYRVLSKVVEALPNLNVRIAFVSAVTMNLQMTRLNAPLTNRGKGITDTKMYAPRFPKPQTEGFNQMTRLNAPPINRGKGVIDIKMYAPRFPKLQTEGFIVMLSYPGRDEIVALRRVGWQSGDSGRGKGDGSFKKEASTRITLPEELEVQKLNVTVLSDGYILMMWTLEGIEIPERPKVDDGGKGKEEEKV